MKMLDKNQNIYFDFMKYTLSPCHICRGNAEFSDFNSKVYKLLNFNDTNMLPGDRNGSPDDCFSTNLVLEVLRWKKH
ncbi:MAG: hypothetical protein QT01_C0002G0052 [archaeon GW2011_AR6]|nr:MAG: hypothetical protein QT01_C0002G0052 [archaeon GW2011_AR6]